MKWLPLKKDNLEVCGIYLLYYNMPWFSEICYSLYCYDYLDDKSNYVFYPLCEDNDYKIIDLDDEEKINNLYVLEVSSFWPVGNELRNQSKITEYISNELLNIKKIVEGNNNNLTDDLKNVINDCNKTIKIIDNLNKSVANLTSNFKQ